MMLKVKHANHSSHIEDESVVRGAARLTTKVTPSRARVKSPSGDFLSKGINYEDAHRQQEVLGAPVVDQLSFGV